MGVSLRTQSSFWLMYSLFPCFLSFSLLSTRLAPPCSPPPPHPQCSMEDGCHWNEHSYSCNADNKPEGCDRISFKDECEHVGHCEWVRANLSLLPHSFVFLFFSFSYSFLPTLNGNVYCLRGKNKLSTLLPSPPSPPSPLCPLPTRLHTAGWACSTKTLTTALKHPRGRGAIGRIQKKAARQWAANGTPTKTCAPAKLGQTGASNSTRKRSATRTTSANSSTGRTSATRRA